MSDLRTQLPDDLHDQLRVVAAHRKTTIKALVVHAVREFLKKEKKGAT